MSSTVVTSQTSFFGRLANLRLLAPAGGRRDMEESLARALAGSASVDVRENQPSRGASIVATGQVATRKAWMLSPDPSLSMIESGYASDVYRGRLVRVTT